MRCFASHSLLEDVSEGQGKLPLGRLVVQQLLLLLLLLTSASAASASTASASTASATAASASASAKPTLRFCSAVPHCSLSTYIT